MARMKSAEQAALTPSQMAQFAGQEMAGQGGVSDAERAILKGVTAIGRAVGGSI
jgi:hypothetical protein